MKYQSDMFHYLFFVLSIFRSLSFFSLSLLYIIYYISMILWTYKYTFTILYQTNGFETRSTYNKHTNKHKKTPKKTSGKINEKTITRRKVQHLCLFCFCCCLSFMLICILVAVVAFWLLLVSVLSVLLVLLNNKKNAWQKIPFFCTCAFFRFC